MRMCGKVQDVSGKDVMCSLSLTCVLALLFPVLFARSATPVLQ
jgi:hypothetical protein